jgi:hypothetical protein
MSDTPANPKPFRLSPGDAFGFSDTGERVPVSWPEPHIAPTSREQFEENLLNLNIPFSTAIAAGRVFDDQLNSLSTAMAAEKLRQFLNLIASTKLAKSIEFLAILKLLSPDKSLEEICAGTGHSKQKLHYQVCRMGKFFDAPPHR